MKWAYLFIFFGLNMAANAQSLIEVASFGRNQPIGCKVSSAGRLFVSFPHHEPFLYALTEIKNGQRVPYPDAAFQSRFKNVQDLWTDDHNQLWVLDSKPGADAAFALYDFDLAGNQLPRVYTFDDLPKAKSALNDVRVDHLHGLAYLSDPGLCAIVVLDLKTGKSRMVLQNDKSTKADPNYVLHLDGKAVADLQGKPFSSNVNGIALTMDNQYFYFRAINQTKLYRIKTADLANADTSGLSAKVEMIAETGVCHGMTADQKENVFISDSQAQAIKYVSPDGKVHTLVTDPRISWPDSMGISPDGYLYFSCSQLNRGPSYNNGKDRTDYPYRVYKVRLPAKAN